MPFTITTPSTSVRLDSDRTGGVPFTVFNRSDQTIVGRVLLHVPRDAEQTSESWFTISGEQERAIPPEGAEHFRVDLAVPRDVPAGTYTFRFDAADVENIDERHVAGPTVSLEVPEAAEEKQTCRWCIPAAVAVALLVVAGGIAAFVLTRGEDTIEIPEVLGLSEDDAIEQLEDAGFIVDTSEESSDTVAAGSVINTDPPVGEAIAEGSAILVFVSSGPNEVEIPDVSGLPEDDAIAELEGAGFTVDTSEQSSDDVAAGSVIDSDPPIGEAIAEGSEILVFVSTGPDEVEIPDVSDLTQSEAVAELEGACEPSPCFDVELDREVHDGGVVTDTDPPAGESAGPGDRVEVITGIEIPDLGGLEHTEARDTLRGMCEPAPCFSENWDGYGQRGFVASTDPDAGEIAEPGIEVTITTGVEIPEVRLIEEDVAIARMRNACEPAPCFEVDSVNENTWNESLHDRGIRSNPAAGEIAVPGTEVTIVIGVPWILDWDPPIVVDPPFEED